MEIDTIIDEYYKKIYKLCLFYLRDEQEAEDMTQEVFLKILAKKSSFKEQSSFYTWIYRIAVNTILNYIKRKKILQFVSFDFTVDSGQELPSGIDNPAELMEQDQLKQIETARLEKAINVLSNREKTAFYLFHYDHLKQKEIAEVMETSISAVESLIHKGMRKIKREISTG
jgi:RNA polymerase sigma-70 factor, ECF subfamily